LVCCWIYVSLSVVAGSIWVLICDIVVSFFYCIFSSYKDFHSILIASYSDSVSLNCGSIALTS
jgi:hypothetical protein